MRPSRPAPADPAPGPGAPAPGAVGALPSPGTAGRLSSDAAATPPGAPRPSAALAAATRPTPVRRARWGAAPSAPALFAPAPPGPAPCAPSVRPAEPAPTPDARPVGASAAGRGSTQRVRCAVAVAAELARIARGRALRGVGLTLTLALALVAGPGAAQSDALAVCGAAHETPERAARFCRMALEGRGLTARQRELARVNLGAALLDLGDAAGAEATYAAAIADGGREPLAWAGRARARETLGRIAEAAADWARATELAPDDAGLRAARGAFLLRGGDAEGALAQFDAGLSQRPRDAGLGYNRALALAALGRDADADAALSAVLRTHPDDLGALITRGRLRAESDPARGLADLDAAVTRAGERPGAYFARAQTLDRLGRRAEADRDYRRAWELGLRDEALNARMLQIGR